MQSRPSPPSPRRPCHRFALAAAAAAAWFVALALLATAVACDRQTASNSGPGGQAAAAAAGSLAELESTVAAFREIRRGVGPAGAGTGSAAALRAVADRYAALSEAARAIQPRADAYLIQFPAVTIRSVADARRELNGTMELFGGSERDDPCPGLPAAQAAPGLFEYVWNPEPAATAWRAVRGLAPLDAEIAALNAELASIARDAAALADAVARIESAAGLAAVSPGGAVPPRAAALHQDVRPAVLALRARLDGVDRRLAGVALSIGTLDAGVAVAAEAIRDRARGLRTGTRDRPYGATLSLDATYIGATDVPSVVALARADLELRRRHRYAFAQKPYHLALPRKTRYTWPLAHAIEAARDFDRWYAWATDAAWYDQSGLALDTAAYPPGAPATRKLWDEFAAVVAWDRPVVYSSARAREFFAGAARTFSGHDVDSFFRALGRDVLLPSDPALAMRGFERQPPPPVALSGAEEWELAIRRSLFATGRFLKDRAELYCDYGVHLHQYFATPLDAAALESPPPPPYRAAGSILPPLKRP